MEKIEWMNPWGSQQKRIVGVNGKIVVGCDLYNLAETGVAAVTLTEGYYKGCGHSGPYVIEIGCDIYEDD